jgi:hypothetical protein
VGYAVDARVASRLADAALRRGICPPGTDRHRGRSLRARRPHQFRWHRYQRALRAHALTDSMGRVSPASAAATMESFFSLLQEHVLNRQSWATRDELRLAIITGVERPTTADDNAPSANSPQSSQGHHRQHSPRTSSVTRTTAVNQSVGQTRAVPTGADVGQAGCAARGVNRAAAVSAADGTSGPRGRLRPRCGSGPATRHRGPCHTGRFCGSGRGSSPGSGPVDQQHPAVRRRLPAGSTLGHQGLLSLES